MTTSLIVAVRVGLVTALKPVFQATDGMSDVYVEFQYPTGNDTPREIVWTQNGRPTFAPAAMRAGKNFLKEDTGFDLMFRAEGPDLSPAEAAQRVIDICTVAVDWIGNHKNGETLSIDGLQTLTVAGEGVMAEFPTDSGYGAGIQIPVKYTARLT